ncbi:MAG: ISAzo13-like element transposase-related protein [Acidimicrobiales bacterium]
MQAAYDPAWYPTGQKINDTDYTSIPLTPHEWHGEWNYTITPPAA